MTDDIRVGDCTSKNGTVVEVESLLTFVKVGGSYASMSFATVARQASQRLTKVETVHDDIVASCDSTFQLWFSCTDRRCGNR